ncbi:MAG: hypothetical protein H6657_21115 [Ardenticatenaceae bacterium]|nr:hypothetical protein [Ardenticatenaceae bacterium]
MRNQKVNRSASRESGSNGLHWSAGGMIGGLFVGLTLANIYGWTLLSATFWIGFGLLVGAMSGGISFLLYRAVAAKRES